MAPADDSQLASCGDDGVRVWAPNGSPLPRPARPAATSLEDPFSSVLWYPSGKLLAAGSRNGAVALYLQGTLAYLSELRPSAPSPPPVTSIDVSNGSRYLAVGAADGSLSVWDMKNRAVDVRFDSETGVSAVSVSIQRTAESRYLACARGSEVTVYSRVSKRLVSKFSVEAAAVTRIAFSPFHINILVVVDDSGCVTVFDITRATTVSSSKAKSDNPVVAQFPSPSLAPATDIAFCQSASASFAFCVSALDKSVRLFSLGSGACRLLYSFTCSAPVTCVAIAGDQMSLAAGTSSGSICFYQLACQPDAQFYSHSLTSEINRAHVLPKDLRSDKMATSPAVRALHYRPRPDPVPSSSLASTSSRAAAVAAAASAAMLETPDVSLGARSKSASANALRPAFSGASHGGLRSAPPPQTEERTPPRQPFPSKLGGSGPGTRSLYNGPRDSDIFSPLPASGPKCSSDGGSSARPTSKYDYGAFDSDEDEAGSSTSNLEGPLSSEKVIFDTGERRRDTVVLPSSQSDVAVDTTSAEAAESCGEIRAKPNDADSSSDSIGIGSAQGVERSVLSSFRRGDSEVLAAAADLTSSISARESLALSGQSLRDSTSFRKPSPGIASRSASDMNRRRLPPLPPRSLSDDAMAAHLRSLPSVPSAAEQKPVVSNEAIQPSPSLTKKTAVQTRGVNVIPQSAASQTRETERGAFAIDEAALRRVVSDEVGSLTVDLQSDVKNLHTELVLSLARQEALFLRIVDDKDKRILELETLAKRLKLENKQLRGTTRKTSQPVPSWMQL